eukprot:TRINITY_DN3708_c0_g2_i9.p1 TRINITY_DN3708_c0_g2~~TRINITY_DN3708_c0_g2_i9.p1  ORF type:complete len:192 (+),score=59.37 TRINITY_DN3708_c0_g2_i9:330-905(+)
MQLILRDLNGNNIAAMTEDDRTLVSYCPQEGYTIHVLDMNPESITHELEDLSQVEKYVISDEDYDKLPDTFRKWKEKYLKQKPAEPKPESSVGVPELDPDYQKAEADKIAPGNRCRLKEKGHRGEVKYVGKIPDMGMGFYVGLKLDEPFGDINGKIFGVTYFSCPAKYGLIVRPEEIEVGDFPELDIDDEI